MGSSDYSVPENPSAHHIADEGEAMTDVWSNVVGHFVRRINLNIFADDWQLLHKTRIKKSFLILVKTSWNEHLF